MSADSSKCSNLIDVTYQALHHHLSGHFEGTTLEQLVEILKPRVEQLKNAAEPFGKPSDTSKKKVDSGSVTLPDGMAIRVEDVDKEFIHALSRRFGIDQVHALVLLRSFFYNEGLPADVGAGSGSGSDGSTASMVQELVNAITPFYYSERLHVLIPLFHFVWRWMLCCGEQENRGVKSAGSGGRATRARVHGSRMRKPSA